MVVVVITLPGISLVSPFFRGISFTKVLQPGSWFGEDEMEGLHLACGIACVPDADGGLRHRDTYR